MKTTYVYGRIPVLECLRAGKRAARKLFVLRSGEGLDRIKSLAADIQIKECQRGELDRLTKNAVHQGVILECEPLPLLRLDDWLSVEREDPLLLVLDGIEDPHNLGAIARSAAAFGASGVLFGKDRSAPVSAVAVKSAAGAMEYIDLIEVNNVARAMDSLHEAGYSIAVLDGHGEQLIWDIPSNGPVALVIGSEGKGVRKMIKRSADVILRIPIEGPISSLNASVSAAVALAEWKRIKSQS
jgi:23S rRNA (guanosine2251-2'-O)-methyltransferase